MFGGGGASIYRLKNGIGPTLTTKLLVTCLSYSWTRDRLWWLMKHPALATTTCSRGVNVYHHRPSSGRSNESESVVRGCYACTETAEISLSKESVVDAPYLVKVTGWLGLCLVTEWCHLISGSRRWHPTLTHAHTQCSPWETKDSSGRREFSAAAIFADDYRAKLNKRLLKINLRIRENCRILNLDNGPEMVPRWLKKSKIGRKLSLLVLPTRMEELLFSSYLSCYS